MTLPLNEHILAGAGGLILEFNASQGADDVSPMIQAAGREQQLHIVDFIEPARSESLDVLEGTPADIAATLVSLLPAENSPGALYYRTITGLTLNIFIDALQSTVTPVRLHTLVELLSSDATFNSWVSAVNAQLPESHRARQNLNKHLELFRRGIADGVPISVALLRQALGGMAGRLAQLSTGTYGELLDSEAPDISLDDIVAKKDILYIRLPGEDEVGSLALARMCRTGVQQALVRARPRPANLEGFEQGSLQGIVF